MDLSEVCFLVVDDFPTMRKLLIKELREMGAKNILEANDGTGAVQHLCGGQVDVIISDWNMPDMGGLELLRWIRSQEQCACLPFLMVTSRGQQQDVVQAVKSGVDAYIVKPFTQETLSEKIARLLPKVAQLTAERRESQALADACKDLEMERARQEILGDAPEQAVQEPAAPAPAPQPGPDAPAPDEEPPPDPV